MKTELKSTESKMPLPPNTNPSGYGDPETPKPEDTPPAGEPKVDDFGYSQPPEEVLPKVEEVPPEEKKDEIIKDKSTGYGEEPKPGDENKDDPKEPKKDEGDPEKDAEKELEEFLGNVGDNYDKEKLTQFAKENGLNKTQIEAYVNMTNAEMEEARKAQEENIKTQRNKWYIELKEDSKFGGENFDKNVDRVERLLKDFMPETKKHLTERGTMLPPSTMRDLLSISLALNPTKEFEQGEQPPEVKSESDNWLSDMYK